MTDRYKEIRKAIAMGPTPLQIRGSFASSRGRKKAWKSMEQKT